MLRPGTHASVGPFIQSAALRDRWRRGVALCRSCQSVAVVVGSGRITSDCNEELSQALRGV